MSSENNYEDDGDFDGSFFDESFEQSNGIHIIEVLLIITDFQRHVNYKLYKGRGNK